MPERSEPAAILADPRYAAVRARDAAADGTFVYAVRTTGIFCRPSCSARPARPENMRFFADGAAAQAAGFRACRRCHPLGEAPVVARMRDIASHIAAHPDETLTLAGLARVAGMSAAHLQRSFTAVIGVSPRAYHDARRLDAFKAGLRAGEGVLAATFDAGYASPARAYAQVDGALGMTPATYRAGGAGETIVHATRITALGPLMMAATQRGVCFVQFGEDAAALLAALAAEFPQATLLPAGAASDIPLAAWMTALDAHLSAGGPHPDLPLDLRGTGFQLRIWRFLMRVPAGRPVSYTELAEGVGAPRAVRAAASACAANRIAILVPCHRALRADGSLGGFRWGLDRKRALLAAERTAADT